MVSEKTIVENRSVGSRWFISLEKELREETGAKYPDKTVLHVSLEGYEDNYQSAKSNLEAAKLGLEKLLTNGKKSAQVSEGGG